MSVGVGPRHTAQARDHAQPRDEIPWQARDADGGGGGGLVRPWLSALVAATNGSLLAPPLRVRSQVQECVQEADHGRGHAQHDTVQLQ